MLLLSVTLGIPFHEIREWSSAELSLYMAYYKLDPWGEHRADLRNALSIKHNLEAQGVKPKGGGKFKLENFMLFLCKAKPDTAKVRSSVRGFFASLKK